jgi:hypothetical protein
VPRRIARGILFAEVFVEFVEPIATESKLLNNINVSNAAMAEGRAAALGFLQPAKDSERLSKRAHKKRPGVAKQPRPVALEAFSYFRELLMEVYLLLRLVPRPFTTATIAIEMPAAISPYSIAVAPDSSRQNFRINSFIVLLSVRGLRASFNLRRLSVRI